MSKKPRKTTSGAAAEPPVAAYARPALLLTVLCVLVFFSFYPVTKYYFFMDDFVLLNRAAYGASSYLSQFFSGEPGQFRPLSKAVYFSVMYRLFELNPFPYHLVSLLVHLLNVVLFYRLLTVLKVLPGPALIASALFGLSVTVMNVVGWIACIQQLLAECFLLLALIFGVRAITRPSLRDTVLSAAAYVLAVMSMEQAWPVPVILFIYAYNGNKSENSAQRLRETARTTAPYLAALAVYVGFMLLWKGIPQSGEYTMSLGANVAANLATYLDRIFQFSVLYPFVINVPTASFTAVHLLLLALVFYHVSRGRGKQVVWALLFFMLTILPTLLLTNHTFYIHLYIPAFGLIYLLALAIDDFVRFVSARNSRAPAGVVAAALILVSIMSITAVRANETNYVRSDFKLPNDFVLRKAMIAKKALDDAALKTSWSPRGGKLFLISQSDVNGWYSRTVAGALGSGDAFKLFYNDPGLEVVFMNRGETITGYNPDDSLILIFDDMGNLYTLEEAQQQTGRPAITQIDNETVEKQLE